MDLRSENIAYKKFHELQKKKLNRNHLRSCTSLYVLVLIMQMIAIPYYILVNMIIKRS